MAVVPAKAGIQRLCWKISNAEKLCKAKVTGFRVKPGMTEKACILPGCLRKAPPFYGADESKLYN
jgi:hypothetical protein